MLTKCPLCGEELAGKACAVCGYVLPDEEKLTALYDLDPDECHSEELPVREITPVHLTDEIYPNRPVRSEVVPEAKPIIVRVRGKNMRLTCRPMRSETVPEAKPIIVRVRGKNMRITCGYTPGARLKVKRVQGTPDIQEEQHVSFDDTVQDMWWLFPLAVLSPTVAVIAWIIAAEKKKGAVSMKFTLSLLIVIILRIIIFNIISGFWD